MITRIQFLARKVKELGVYAIEEFNYSGVWIVEGLEADEYAANNMDEADGGLTGDQQSVDVPMVRITEDHFFFQACPKNCGDDMQLSTMRIDLGELESNEPLVKETEY